MHMTTYLCLGARDVTVALRDLLFEVSEFSLQCLERVHVLRVVRRLQALQL